MFRKKKNDELELAQLLAKNLENTSNLLTYVGNYCFDCSKENRGTPVLMYFLLDYVTMYLLQIYGCNDERLDAYKKIFEEEHSKLLLKLISNKDNKLNINNKLEDINTQLKQFGIKFDLKMDDYNNPQKTETPKVEESKDNIELPPLSKFQIDKIIKMNYDRIIDMYLEKKKKKEEEDESK
jgi:hypothetical protein